MSKALMLSSTLILALAAGCSRLADVGQAPEFSATPKSPEYIAMTVPILPSTNLTSTGSTQASLWSVNRRSLLGDRRATSAGDILTVIIEIDDRAEISNSTGRSRSSEEKLTLNSLFGLPQNLTKQLPTGTSLSPGVDTSSESESTGSGSVSRKEKLTLRIAATIIGRMPSGVLQISGKQEVRVNYELRELIISGFVRPEDITRYNEVTYDKIASARISYGGRGQISDVQQPRYGQQIADIVLPF